MRVKRKQRGNTKETLRKHNYNTNTNTSKYKYGEYVLLSREEYKKLVEKDGESFVKACIERLDNYIGSSGKKYVSHYRTILSWVRDTELQKGDWKDADENQRF